MKLKLDYGTTGLAVDVPERAMVIEPLYVPPVADPAGTLVQAISSPIGKPPLRELVRPGQKVGISVCDITRAQPRQVMLEGLLAQMPGIRLQNVTIFIATGTHRRNNDEEIERMVGREFARNCRIVCHDARDAATLIHVSNTSTGMRVLLN